MAPASPKRTPNKAERQSLESACSDSSRKALLATCEEWDIRVNRKDSTSRIREKVKKFLETVDDAGTDETAATADDAEPPAQPETTPAQPEPPAEPETTAPAETTPPAEDRVPVGSWKKKVVVAIVVAIAAVGVASLAPSTKRRPVLFPKVGGLNAIANFSEDARTEATAFLRGWESRSRRHAALLLLVGPGAGAAAETLAADVSADALHLGGEQDLSAAALRHVRDARARGANSLLLLDVETASPAFAEHLVDPYYNLVVAQNGDDAPPLDAAAFIWTLADDAGACLAPSGDRTLAARDALRRHFDANLPDALYNRIHHAALVC